MAKHPTKFGPWRGYICRVSDSRHKALVWLSARDGWRGECRKLKISVKGCRDSDEAKGKMDAELVAAGMVLEGE